MIDPTRFRARYAVVLGFLALTACSGKGKNDAPADPGAAPAASSTSAPPAAAPGDASAAASIPSHTTVTTSPAAAPPPKPGERRAIATVNGKPIYEDKVYAVYRMNRQMLQQRGRTLDENQEKVLRSQSLQMAVADELFYQDSLKKGMKVTPADVDHAVKDLKVRVGSEEKYKQFVAESGFSDIDVRHELERNLITDAYRKNLFAGKTVSDEQAKKFYDENVSKGMFSVPEQVHVQFIVLRTGEKDPDAVKAEAKKRAEEAAKKAAAGEDFAALAKQYSQDPSAERGGDIGLVPRGVMFPKFDEIAFSLAPGSTSPAFETPRGYGVLKVLEKKPAGTRTYDDVKDGLKLDMGRLLQQDALKAKASELAAVASIDVLDPSYMPTQQAAATPPPAPPQAAKKP